MATKLTNYDFTTPSTLTRAERRTYPWDEWFDGNIWCLVVGEDFDAHPLMMERIIRTRATGRKSKVQLHHEPLNGDKYGCGILVMRRSDIPQPRAKRIKPVKKITAAAKTPPPKTTSAAAKKLAAAPQKVTKASQKAVRPRGGVHHPGPAYPAPASAQKPTAAPKRQGRKAS